MKRKVPGNSPNALVNSKIHWETALAVRVERCKLTILMRVVFKQSLNTVTLPRLSLSPPERGAPSTNRVLCSRTEVPNMVVPVGFKFLVLQTLPWWSNNHNGNTLSVKLRRICCLARIRRANTRKKEEVLWLAGSTDMNIARRRARG